MSSPERDPSAAIAAEPAAPLVRVREFGVTHDGEITAAPASVSFDIAGGEVVLLLGPSGSGKSTLTLALNGLIPHAVPAEISGTVEVDGIATTATTVAELSTRVAMVFQDPDAQLVTGTLLDEVAFGPENLRMPVTEVLERSEAALRRVGLWDRRTENPDRLSGGGRQRLAIACALAMGSPLLVLDEPTANLDPRGIEEVYAALAELVATGDRAILLVEHNLDAAVGFVDRVVVLDHDGRLAADGTVDEVLRHRADELHAMGVWLPVSAIAALRLRRAGYVLNPLPLTPAELHAALEGAEPSVPAASDGPQIRNDAPESDAPTPSIRIHTQNPIPAPGPAAEASPPVAGSGGPRIRNHAPESDASTPSIRIHTQNPTPAPGPAEASAPPAGSDGPQIRNHAPESDAPTPSIRIHTQNPTPAPGPAAEASAPAGSGGPRIRNHAPESDAPTPSIRIHTQNPTPAPGPAVASAPLITVRDLTLRRGRTDVLQDIDIDIAAGEFVAVVGANGAGKTSLIQALAGVVPPPRGTVHVGGIDVGRSDARTLSSRIGFVFQNPEHQFIAHTVFDEVAHGLRLRHLADDEVRERTMALLARFGLEGKADAHPFLLSGGQKRRLSVGTALVAGAPVLVLDEPTFGQDRARADELLGLLGELNAEGTTIVVVTHDMQLVTEYAHRTIVLAGGRVLASGATADVFGDADLIDRAGLRLPPLRRALHGLARHPELAGAARLADLPDAGPIRYADPGPIRNADAASIRSNDVADGGDAA